LRIYRGRLAGAPVRPLPQKQPGRRQPADRALPVGR
jgi:hypothetical protein